MPSEFSSSPIVSLCTAPAPCRVLLVPGSSIRARSRRSRCQAATSTPSRPAGCPRPGRWTAGGTWRADPAVTPRAWPGPPATELFRWGLAVQCQSSPCSTVYLFDEREGGRRCAQKTSPGMTGGENISGAKHWRGPSSEVKVLACPYRHACNNVLYT